MHYLFNGKETEQQAHSIAFNDRAWNYGDGVFETIIGKNGQILNWKRHHRRISMAMKALHLDDLGHFDIVFIKKWIESKIKTMDFARIKWIVWRKEGGLYSPTSTECNYLVSITTWEPGRVPYERKACISQNVQLAFHPYSRFKTLSALPYVMAGIEKKERQMDELILCDVFGRVSEASAMNIFWQKDKKLYTPSLSTGCIEGVMRSKILDSVNGIQLCEIKPDELIEADAIVTCNVTGIYPIDILEGYDKEGSRQLAETLQYLTSEQDYEI